MNVARRSRAAQLFGRCVLSGIAHIAGRRDVCATYEQTERPCRGNLSLTPEIPIAALDERFDFPVGD